MAFHLIAIAYLLVLAGCNYTDGPCWRRGEGGAYGGVGGSLTVVGVGVGGFGVSPEPQSLEEEEELSCNKPDPGVDPDKEVVCRKKSWGVDCMIACAEEGLACPPELKHPYSPSSGSGKLWKCTGETNKEICKYVYENGDECTWDKARDVKACKYTN